MSEMTATRMGWSGPRIARLGTLAVVAGIWAFAAVLLWRTTVPTNLHLTGLDVHRYFTPGELSKAADYSIFTRWNWVLAQLASLAALAVIAWRAPRIVETIGIGRIGKGVIVGMVTLVAVFFATVPFTLAQWLWDRHYGLVKGNIFSWWAPQLPTLASGAMFSALAILIVMLLGGRWPRGWWIPAAPVFALLALLFTFVGGYLARAGAHPLHDPRLRAAAQSLRTRAGAPGVPIRVNDVSGYTTEANAESIGLGPSRLVVLDNTILRKPFTFPEDKVVLAHELTHQARNHLWKGVAWFALLAIPGTFLIALVTRRGGGVRNPGMIPLGLLVIAILQLISLPFVNAISRRYEAEADWGALRTTHDPTAARTLFAKFTRTSLQEPDPPFWDYVLLENHPTIGQRIQMANAFAARSR
jgi:Zn-dependent protease with chaperone function